MTQPTNTTNWVIQGSNGQPQMIKLVQSTGKTISGIMTTTTVAGQPVKIFKPPTNNPETSQLCPNAFIKISLLNEGNTDLRSNFCRAKEKTEYKKFLNSPTSKGSDDHRLKKLKST
ncbi:unnamed protein product, partial [Callosobruchus maculatus]